MRSVYIMLAKKYKQKCDVFFVVVVASVSYAYLVTINFFVFWFFTLHNICIHDYYQTSFDLEDFQMIFIVFDDGLILAIKRAHF